MKTKYFICAFLFIGIMVSCGTQKIVNPDDKIVGNWSIVAAATPQGDVPITMTISKNEAGLFVGMLNSAMGDFPMDNLTIKDGVMSCNFDVDGMGLGFKGVFTGDEFKGEVLGPDENYVTNGSRIME